MDYSLFFIVNKYVICVFKSVIFCCCDLLYITSIILLINNIELYIFYKGIWDKLWKDEIIPVLSFCPFDIQIETLLIYFTILFILKVNVYKQDWRIIVVYSCASLRTLNNTLSIHLSNFCFKVFFFLCLTPEIIHIHLQFF